MAAAPHLAGAAVLDDGRVVAVLQPAELVGRPSAPEQARGPSRARIIVADDSLSTRSAMKALLELAGFRVLPAADGEEALALARGVRLRSRRERRPDAAPRRPGAHAAPQGGPAARAAMPGRPRDLARRARGSRRRPRRRRRRLPREARRAARQAPRSRAAAAPGMIRCLVVDDARAFRAVLREILSSAAGVEVVGEAADGREAVALVRTLRPDVVTMDVRMPRLDGLAALEEIMRVAPTPVVVVSAEAGGEAQAALVPRAPARRDRGPREAARPRARRRFERQAEAIRQAVRAVAGLRARAGAARPVRPVPPARSPRPAPAGRPSSPAPAAPRRRRAGRSHRGARHRRVDGRPGGARAASWRRCPAELPVPILVVQHIAAGVRGGARALARRRSPALEVRLAEDGAPLAPGTVHVAADGRHLGRARRGAIRLCDEPPLHGFRPSGTHLFSSVAREFGPRGGRDCPLRDGRATAPTGSRCCGAPAATRPRRALRPPWSTGCRGWRSTRARRRTSSISTTSRGKSSGSWEVCEATQRDLVMCPVVAATSRH